jgi:geranylgeranyl transferase type-2 subunit beta
MLQVARLAPKLLGESSDLVRRFIGSQQQPDGGFAGRGGSSDLYYTVFALQALVALQAEIPASDVRSFLIQYEDGGALDFVHLVCLARAWAMMPRPTLDAAATAALLSRLEEHRSADGGYASRRGAPHGTAYDAFLALGAYQDLNQPLPDPEALARSVAALRAADGGYSNQRDAAAGVTPATAAAVLVLRQLDASIPDGVSASLLARCHPEGGFLAAAGAPMPDLLSTATALHALTALHASLSPIAERCLDFVDTLWVNRGAFYGTWADEQPDCEYTYYGLLALGHLSLAA